MMCKASLNVTIQVPTFGVLLDLLSWHDACEPFNPVANKTVEAAVAWAIPKAGCPLHGFWIWTVDNQTLPIAITFCR